MPDTQGNWSEQDLANTIIAVRLRCDGKTYAEIGRHIGLKSSGRHYVLRGARRIRSQIKPEWEDIRPQLEIAIAIGQISSDWHDLQPTAIREPRDYSIPSRRQLVVISYWVDRYEDG